MTFKKVIKPAALSCLIPLILTAQSAAAEDNKQLYSNFVTIKAGFDQANDLGTGFSRSSVDGTYVAGFEVGKIFMDDTLSASLEYSHRGNSDASHNVNKDQIDSWKVRSDTFMANLSANLMKNAKVTPYVKVGIGASTNKAGDYVNRYYDQGNLDTQLTSPGRKTTEFAWQVGAGLTIPTYDRFDTQIEYMFVDRGKIQTEAGYYTLENTESLEPSSAKTTRLRDHVITLGIKIKF
jgi:opacity protein-like surface antigen